MRFPPDAGLARMLESFGLPPEAMLGPGGEALVYALDEQRVVRRVVLFGAREAGAVDAGGAVERVARLSFKHADVEVSPELRRQ